MSEELPPGWVQSVIGALGSWVGGGTPSKSEPSFWTGGAIPWVSPKDMKADRIADAADKITEAAVQRSATRIVPAGSVLVVTRSGILEHTLPVAVTDVPVAINQDLKALMPASGVDAEFVALGLKARAGDILQACSKAGTTVANINLRLFQAFPFPVPPLAEQRRIVARIEALFARIRQARADLQRIAPLARQFRDRTLAVAFDAAWPEVSIADLAATIFDGPFGSNLKSSDYTSEGTRVVRLENLGHLNFIDEKETFIPVEKGRSLARHTLQADDVLFSSFVDKEVRVCRLPNHLADRAINKADCFCIRVDRHKALPAFVEKRLASPVTYEDLREAVHGATRPRIGLSNLKAYCIGLPTIETQSETVTTIELAHSASRTFEHEAARALALLDHLERAILARAFRGDLVPQDPADEPAAALLARLATGATAPARRGRPRRAA